MGALYGQRMEKDSIHNWCGDVKGCFGLSSDCVANASCETLMTYMGIDENTYHIEMETKEGQAYVAVGFGAVQDMGPAVVIACAPQTSYKTIPSIAMYYNRGKVTPDLLANSTLAISNPMLQHADGNILCTFDIEAKVKIPDPKNNSNIFNMDLNKNSYHLLLAIGPLASNGQVGYHSNKIVSSKKYSLADFNSFTNNIFDGCGDNKGCFGLTDNCVANKSCETIMTYIGTDENTYHIEMRTKGQSYVAGGFGTVQDMGPAVVIACAQQTDYKTDSNIPNIAMYYNRGKVTPDLLTNSTLAISNPNITDVDGVLSCSFDIEAKKPISDPKNNSNVFDMDLNKNSYYLLLAIGPLASNGQVGYHTNKIVSQKKYNMADFNSFTNNSNPIFDGCGDTKGCFGLTDKCVTEKSCETLMSYVGIDKETYHIEMQTIDKSYVAGAFGTVQSMGPAIAVACSQQSDDKSVPNIAMYYNPGKTTPVLLANQTLAISNQNVTVKDGVLWCSFDIKAKATISLSKDHTGVFAIYSYLFNFFSEL